MDRTMLQAIFAVVLVLIFIFLLACTLRLAKKNIEKKRHKNLTVSRKAQQSQLKKEMAIGKSYWFNKQDMENADAVEQLRYQHYFDDWQDCVSDLIIEMYDCGLVRTEELFAIAYGRDALTPDSLIFQTEEISDYENEPASSLDHLPPISKDAQQMIYEKWTGYVEQLLDIVEIHASEEDKGAITDSLMTYGKKDLSVLLYSPE